MHESEQVLQRKATILCKYHAQVCHAMPHGLPNHEQTRTRYSNLTISQHNPRCSDARSNDNGMQKSMHYFIIRSSYKDKHEPHEEAFPWMFREHPQWPRLHLLVPNRHRHRPRNHVAMTAISWSAKQVRVYHSNILR
jgi:hypothetical protein